MFIMSSPAPLRIGLLLYDSCMPYGLFCFEDLLHAANRRAGRPVFETVFLSLGGASVQCAHGHRLLPDGDLLHTELDALLLPGRWVEAIPELDSRLDELGALTAALARLPRSVTVLAYCSGVLLLAASGRLNGQTATAIWWLGDIVRKRFPKVQWDIERSTVMGKHWGTAADTPQLLAREMIDRHVGKRAYQEMARMMELSRPARIHEAFLCMDLAQQGDEFMRELFLMVQALPASEVSLRGLAENTGMTESTLARRIKAEANMSAAGYLRRIKLHQVSERLILTSTPASAISDSLGFSSESSMRRMFKELTGMTPAEYRQTYKRPALAA
jgi:transcriptional regulator GlxA family with amidase domain